jgi:ribonuclease VapC
MIAVDTSALLAIVLDEPEAELFAKTLLSQDCLIGAPTALECHFALRRFGKPKLTRTLQHLIGARTLETVPFGSGHLPIAKSAFDRYGKGIGHRARLNFGDCLAYAVAKLADVPLLFKGDDFVHTDIAAAITSRA